MKGEENFAVFSISAAGVYENRPLIAWLEKNFGVRWLPRERHMEADFLICDTMNEAHLHFKGVKIMLTGENHPVDLNHFDYCLTHEYREDDRCHRFPYWQQAFLFRYLENPSLFERPRITAEELVAQGRAFCAFVCRNAACRRRNRLVRRLSLRRRVDCGGPFMNNIGYCVKDKVAFLHGRYLGIAYENESSPGYQTEKIMDAYLARCIPVYWGNPRVGEEFNPASFVDAASFRSEDELISCLLQLAENPERMAKMLNAPVFQDPDILAKAEKELYRFFERIFSRGPGAIQRTRWQRRKAFLSNFYGHGLFLSLRRISRRLRGKERHA